MLPPSQRPRARYIAVPSGCTDVWEVRIPAERQPSFVYVTLHICAEEAHAYELADEYWNKKIAQSRYDVDPKIWVNHRAAILLEGKHHFVLKPSFKLSERVSAEALPVDEWYPKD